MSSVYVDRVEVTVVGAPWRELAFVDVICDDGIRVVGVVRMGNKTNALVPCVHELADRHLVGNDPFDLASR